MRRRFILPVLAILALSIPAQSAYAAQAKQTSEKPIGSIADNVTVIDVLVGPLEDLGHTIRVELSDIASTPRQERKARERRDARRRAKVARREAAQVRRQAAEDEAAIADLGVSTDTLESIAACESGGEPAIVSSDGSYRGKYQFSYETWAGVGGSGDPAAAPESEQDYRAALLYAQSGPGSWPICGA